MCNLSYIAPVERPGVDPYRIEALVAQLGTAAAEDLVFHVMEDLARRLSLIHKTAVSGPKDDLYTQLGYLSEKALFIGLVGLARVAHDVQVCIEDADPTAEAATLARLARSGERSLALLWDLQDVSL